MNAQSYVQTRCPRCGQAAWGHPTQPVPCSTCGQVIAALAQAPAAQASPSYGQAPQQWVQAPQQPYAQAPQQPFAQAPQQQQQYAQAPQQFAQATPAHGHAPAYAPPQQPAAAAQGNAPVVHMQLPYGIKLPLKVGGAGMKLKLIGGVVLAIVLAIGGVIVKSKLGTTAKGNLSYSSLGIDRKKADPDKMIVAVGNAARKWRKDAAWWAINLQAVKADGTVDVTNGGAQVTYISPSGVQAASDRQRKDSIKKFGFGPAGVDHKAIWGATDPWEGVVPPDMPACGIKNVVALLTSKGLTGDKTVRITFDPQFAGVVPVDAWHVIGTDPKIDAYYSMADCSVVASK